MGVSIHPITPEPLRREHKAVHIPCMFSKPKRGFRFSLLTLLTLVMLIGSVGVLYHNWEPWVLMRKWVTAVPGSSSMWPSYVAVTSDGSKVAIASEDKVLHLFDVGTGRELWSTQLDFRMGNSNTMRFLNHDRV